MYFVCIIQAWSQGLELVRWTFLPLKELTNGAPSIINTCIRQHKLCSEYGLANCDTLENKAAILQGLYELDSLVFDEYELRLGSCDQEDDSSLSVNYDLLKTRLNEVYLKQKQVETAMKLAEKYVDFATLVIICEMRADTDLLESYLDKFANTRFAEFVVKHFKEKRKLSFLLKNQFLKAYIFYDLIYSLRC